jgi:hypothetical protein
MIQWRLWVLGGVLSSAALGASVPAEFYTGFGAGVVFPSKNGHSKGKSNSILFSPTEPGVSLFSLPRVEWDYQYKTGYEIYALAGFELCSAWDFEVEGVYQNFNRDISGSYDWRELNAVNNTLFAQNFGDPIAESSTAVNLFALMTNVGYSLRGSSPWSGYVGGGFGIAWIDSSSTLTDDLLHINIISPPLNITAPTRDESPSFFGNAFVWQFKGAIKYNCSSCFTLGLNYRLLGTTKFEANSSVIITNPDTAEEARFEVPQGDLTSMLNNSVSLSFDFHF